MATAIPMSGTNPYYQYCSDAGAQIFYYDAVKQTPVIIVAGDAPADTSCK